MPIYAARWLLPVASRPVRDGAVHVDRGEIVAAGPRDAVLEAAEDETEIRELGESAILPGLVNAHTHLELSWMGRDRPPAGDYLGWIRDLLERRETEDRARATEAAEREIETSIRRGVVAVGDVGNATWIVPLLARSGLHGVAFHELIGFRAADAESLLEAAVERLEALERDPDVGDASARLRVVLTPHAPHTTSPGLLRALAGRASATGDPLSIHLAESPEETQLLDDGSGSFAELLRARDQWDDGFVAEGHSPVEHLDRLGALTPRTLAVHGIQLDHPDHVRLQQRGATVVTCPRSNAALGVGKAPVPALMREGIPVALGTDSLASVPDLDLFAELAALRLEHPSISPAAALRIATLNGAQALGLDSRLGSIEPGKLARLIVVPLPDAEADALETICSVPETVWALEDAPA